MNNNAGWGSNPTGQGSSVPKTPATEGKDGKWYFTPLAGIQYHVTVLSVQPWQQPMEIWCHDIKANGKFEGNNFCKKKSADDFCPYCAANSQREFQNGSKLENKFKPYPISKKFIFPIKVDEIPEHQYLWYKVSEKFLGAIQGAIGANGGMGIGGKIIIQRTGKGIETQYVAYPANQPIDPNANNVQLPPAERATFVDFADYSNVQGASQQPPQQQNAQQQQNNFPPVQQAYQTNIQQSSNQSYVQQNAPQQQNNGAYTIVVTDGMYAGKKLCELDTSVLRAYCQMTNSEFSPFAKQILTDRGENV